MWFCAWLLSLGSLANWYLLKVRMRRQPDHPCSGSTCSRCRSLLLSLCQSLAPSLPFLTHFPPPSPDSNSASVVRLCHLHPCRPSTIKRRTPDRCGYHLCESCCSTRSVEMLDEDTDWGLMPKRALAFLAQEITLSIYRPSQDLIPGAWQKTGSCETPFTMAFARIATSRGGCAAGSACA